MTRAVPFASILGLVFGLFLSTTPAFAGGRPACGPASPRMDVFTDGSRQLRLIEIPDYDGEGSALTFVYDDGHAARSVTIDPSKVQERDSVALQSFLAEVDESFISFVRASLADRVLHLSAAPSTIERSLLAVFFPGREPSFGHGRADSLGE